MSPNLFFLLASILFSIGIVGIVSRKNIFVLYMSAELLLSSVNIILATYTKITGDADGAVMALFIIAVIASEAALFLAMIIHLYKNHATIDSDNFFKIKEITK